MRKTKMSHRGSNTNKKIKKIVFNKIKKTILLILLILINLKKTLTNSFRFILKYKKTILIFFILITFYLSIYMFKDSNNLSEEYITKDNILSRIEKIKSFDQDQDIDLLRVKDSDEIKKISDNFQNVLKGDFIIVFKDEYWVYDYHTNRIKEIITRNNH